LEVRRPCDGRPPVTERERDIRLNGICGVIILKSPGCESSSGLFLLLLLILIATIASKEDQEQDQDYEQESKLSTFARPENW
jgi:hypothetical protein